MPRGDCCFSDVRLSAPSKLRLPWGWEQSPQSTSYWNSIHCEPRGPAWGGGGGWAEWSFQGYAEDNGLVSRTVWFSGWHLLHLGKNTVPLSHLRVQGSLDCCVKKSGRNEGRFAPWKIQEPTLHMGSSHKPIPLILTSTPWGRYYGYLSPHISGKTQGDGLTCTKDTASKQKSWVFSPGCLADSRGHVSAHSTILLHGICASGGPMWARLLLLVQNKIALKTHTVY